MTIHLPIINPQSISTILHWCCKGYCDQLSLLLLYVCVWSKRETWIVIILICSFNFLRNSFDVSLLFFIKSNKILFLTTYNIPCESYYTQVGLSTVQLQRRFNPKHNISHTWVQVCISSLRTQRYNLLVQDSLMTPIHEVILDAGHVRHLSLHSAYEIKVQTSCLFSHIISISNSFETNDIPRENLPLPFI